MGILDSLESSGILGQLGAAVLPAVLGEVMGTGAQGGGCWGLRLDTVQNIHTKGGRLTQEHQGHTEHVEQRQGSENGGGVERMIDPIDDEGDNAGQDG